MLVANEGFLVLSRQLIFLGWTDSGVGGERKSSDRFGARLTAAVEVVGVAVIESEDKLVVAEKTVS